MCVRKFNAIALMMLHRNVTGSFFGKVARLLATRKRNCAPNPLVAAAAVVVVVMLFKLLPPLLLLQVS